MATSKRALYKPAAQDPSAPKERRKALAQGRLISNPVTGYALPQKDEDHRKDVAITNQATRTRLKQGQDKTCGATGFSDMHAENATTPRKEISSGGLIPFAKLKERQTDIHLVIFKEEREDEAEELLRMVPQVLTKDSPKLAKPTMSLDLSDTEDERGEGRASEVIVIDASRQIKSLDDTEVDISMHFAQSPAKVVCHTPSKVHSDLRNTGNVEQAARVCVDTVPSVCILDSEDSNSMEVRQQTTLHKVPTVVREGGIVGKRIEQKSLMSDDGTQQMRAKSHFEALMARSDRQNIQSHTEIDSSDQGSEFSENDPTRDAENHNGVNDYLSTGKATSLAAVDEDISRAMTKKKAPRIVASRYLQTANNPRRPLRATDKTLLGNTNIGSAQFNTTIQKKLHTSSSLNRTKHVNGTMKKHSSAVQLNSGGTPNIQDSSSHGGVSSSTPKADESVFFGNKNIDMSAIGDLPISRRGQPVAGLFSRSISTDGIADFSKLSGHSDFDSGLLAQGQKKRSCPSDINQWTLELLYDRHLQWAFLASKARKTFHDQEKQAMEQLNSLVELNNNQDERMAELELELEKLHHTNSLDEALELQYSGLGSSTDKLLQLKEQHHHLAEALDTTRHHIPTKDIYIPDNEEQYADGIARALLESEQLLGEISAMTRSQTEDIDQCAKVLQAMEKVVDREKHELSRCNTLLSAAVTLTTQENSLMVQQIQTRPQNI